MVNKKENSKKKKDKKENSLDNIGKAIQDFIDEHGGNAMFVGSFFAFDDNSEVVDDRLFAYGDKEVLKISLEEIIKEIDKEEDFVNW